LTQYSRTKRPKCAVRSSRVRVTRLRVHLQAQDWSTSGAVDPLANIEARRPAQLVNYSRGCVHHLNSLPTTSPDSFFSQSTAHTCQFLQLPEAGRLTRHQVSPSISPSRQGGHSIGLTRTGQAPHLHLTEHQVPADQREEVPAVNREKEITASPCLW
jgi:hypothetical protein